MALPADQVGGYISGSGLFYERYEITSDTIVTTGDFKTALAASSANVIRVAQDDTITPKIKGELSSENLFPQKHYA